MNPGDERILSCGMREHPEPRPRDEKDAAQDIARNLADIAGQLASLNRRVQRLPQRPELQHAKAQARGGALCGRGCGRRGQAEGTAERGAVAWGRGDKPRPVNGGAEISREKVWVSRPVLRGNILADFLCKIPGCTKSTPKI